MGLMRKPELRRFNYLPRYYRPEADENKQIRFRRKTVYNPRQSSRKPLLLAVVIILVAAIIYILGGIKPSVKPFKIAKEDAVTVLRDR